VADLGGYPASYVVSAGIQALVFPFIILARRENAPSDPILADGEPAPEPAAPVAGHGIAPGPTPAGPTPAGPTPDPYADG
jgi:hypothetical protein